MLNAIWAVMILLAVIYGAVTGHMSDVTDAALDSAGEAISLCITMAGVVALWMGLMEIAGKAGLVEKLTRGISPFMRFMFPRIPAGHPAGEYIATNIIANVLGLGWACTPAGLKAMEELAKLEAERGNPEYLEGGKGEQAPKGQRSFQEKWSEDRLIQAGQSGKGYGERSRTGQGRMDSGRSGAGRGAGKQENSGKNRRASNEMCTFLILNISSLQLIPVNMIAYRAQYGSANPTAIIAPAIAATLFSSVVAVVYCKIKDRTSVHTTAYKTHGTDELTASERPREIRNKVYSWQKPKNMDVSLQVKRRNGGGKVV